MSRDIVCKTKKPMDSSGGMTGSSLTVLSMISSSSGNGGAGGPGGNGQQNGGGMGMGINGGSPDSTTQQTTSNSASSSPAGNGNSSSSTTTTTSLANGILGGVGGGTGLGGRSATTATQATTTTPPNMYSLKWNTQLLALQRSLANLWDSGIGTDAVLLCQGTPLPVHKIILTAASPYVASVVHTMSSVAHMMPVIVVDIPAEAGKALLSFLYCGEAHVPVSIIPQLVAGAKFLGISGFGEPGVLESLTGMMPERDRNSMNAPSPSPSQTSSVLDKSSSSLRSTDSPFTSKSESSYGDPLHIPQMQLPVFPIHGVHVSHVPSPSYLSSQLQSVQNSNSNSSNSNMSRKSADRSKSNSPYPPHFMDSHTNKIIQGNKHQLPAFVTKKSPKNRIFMGGTSILDNLLKNPKGSTGSLSHTSGSNYNDSPVNLSCSSGGTCNEGSDNSEHQKYEADGYADNATVNSQPHGFYYSPAHHAGSGGHGHYMEDTQLMDQIGDNDNDVDNGPIPAQLLEPNVEYHIGKEFTTQDRYGGLTVTPQNPLLDLAKVASSMHPQLHHGERGVKRKQIQQQIKGTGAGNHDMGGNGVELISSTGRHSILEASPPQLPPVKIKIKKTPEAIICEICGKKFSNAYNLRVHMEGHSGQVFVCSVCSHASRSRDALRKHFAYRHRELWISGMSAFRKNVPGRKLSISKSNNPPIKMELPDSEPNNNNISNSNNNNNDNSSNALLDSNGNFNLNIRGSDGTLTISEAFPDNSHKLQK